MSGGVIVVPPGVVVGTAPDRATERDARAIVSAILDAHFMYSGAGPDNKELFFQRYCGQYVDLMTFNAMGEKPSGAQRYERNGFPWPRDQMPEPVRCTDPGTLWDVLRQVREWRTD